MSEKPCKPSLPIQVLNPTYLLRTSSHLPSFMKAFLKIIINVSVFWRAHYVLAHIFFSQKPYEADLFIPSLKIATLKLRATIGICLSLHSTGRVGFESSAKASPLALPAATPLSTITAPCTFWNHRSCKLVVKELNSAMDRILKLFSKIRRSEKCGFLTSLKNYEVLATWMCVPTWPWSRGTMSSMPLHMGLALSPSLA